MGTKPVGNCSSEDCIGGSVVGSIGVEIPVGTNPGGMSEVEATGGGGTGIMGDGITLVGNDEFDTWSRYS